MGSSGSLYSGRFSCRVASFWSKDANSLAQSQTDFPECVYVGSSRACGEWLGITAYPRHCWESMGLDSSQVGWGGDAGCCPDMIRACLWPTEDEESYEAAATPVSGAFHMPLAAPRPRLPRSHNAPIVRSSARLPPGEQLRAKGLGRALMPGVQSGLGYSVVRPTWILESEKLRKMKSWNWKLTGAGALGCLDWRDGPVPKVLLCHQFTFS